MKTLKDDIGVLAEAYNDADLALVISLLEDLIVFHEEHEPSATITIKGLLFARDAIPETWEEFEHIYLEDES